MVHSEPPERALLLDALSLAADIEVTLVSREPLGAGAVAGFDVRAVGEPATYFIDTSERRVDRETGLLQGSPDAPEVRVWLHPSDPHLPALAPVAFAHAAASLLARLGIEDIGTPEIVAYRPGRRAVLRVDARDAPVWIKVVPPSRLARIVDVHRHLVSAGLPIPALLGWSETGLLVIGNAAGVPAAEAPWTPDGFVSEVDDLRARLARLTLNHSARTHLERRLDWYAERLAAVLPADAAAVAAAVANRARAVNSPEPAESVHGDLHFGQLFLDDRHQIVGVIDVDTAGTGVRSADSGAFIAHAVASALLTAAPRDVRVWQLARVAFERWDVSEGPSVRSRAATHLLGHTLGAWEATHHDRALALLAMADAVSHGDAAALDASTPGPSL
ncbi:phosphotransferase [Microbacterium lacus]|uniref:phosphotransferase n=1 Tax=Microbacterium lacus TaxID=415217 RepID=UPI00384F813F